MTRLHEDDIGRIARRLPEYDARLERVTGVSLRQLACRATGVDEAVIVDLLDRVRIAAIPITSGLGVIEGFSDTVAAIVSHLGFDAFVTEGTDVAGTAEGVERGADVLMLADDDRFVAITPRQGQVVDNSLATARGFVAGLELMRGGLEGESVLLLGCGPVGRAAALAMLEHGASVALHDRKPERARDTLEEIGPDAPGMIRIEDDLRRALAGHELIFDATDSGGFIEAAHLTPTSVVAAPGIPCALTPQAMAEHRDRVLHDVLEIGTATMAVQAAAALASSGEPEKAGQE